MTPPDNLKACPFCPSTDMTIYSNSVAPKPYSVECNVCGATSGCYESKQEAIDTWNTRTPDPVLAELVEHWKKRKDTTGPMTLQGPVVFWWKKLEKLFDHLEPETKGELPRIKE